MRTSFCISVVLSLVVLGCGEKAQKSTAATNGTASSSSPLTAPVDYLGAVGKAQQSAVKVVDTTSLDRAIQMFTVDEGRNPKDLNELVEKKYLPQLPAAPYGMKLSYDATSGKVKVVKQ